MSGPAGSASCEAFIEALGLKTLFAAFMGKVNQHSRLLLELLQLNIDFRVPKSLPAEHPPHRKMQDTYSVSYHPFSPTSPQKHPPESAY